MRAVICSQYGTATEVLHVGHREKPKARGDELLIAVKASAVTSADCRIRALQVPAGFSLLMRLAFGFSKPRNPVLGLDFSGVVVGKGESSEGFAIGDEVFGTTGTKMGCHAEFVTVRASGAVVRKPPELPFEAAAVFPFGFLTALSFLRDQARLREGQSILVYGASGSVGSAAVQLAKAFGARVTGVCSGANSEIVRSLGAEHVIDYRIQDMSLLEETYDVVFDTVGKLGFRNGVRLAKQEGTFLMAVAGIPDYLRILRSRFGRGPKISAGMAGEKKADLEFLSGLLADGVLSPLVDRSFALSEIVEAHLYVESGRKRGNVALRIEE